MASKTTVGPGSLNHLFSGAVSDGIISQATSSLLTGNLGPVVIAGAAGKDAETIVATDVTLITLIIDKSSSINDSHLVKSVREGQNMLLDAFSGSQEEDDILISLWTFNENQEVIHSYVPVKDAVRLNGRNYKAYGCTSLYDTWCDACAANVAYAHQLRDSGTPCKSIIVIITDGWDVSSYRKQSDCKKISSDLLASEQFILAFVGVGDAADFRQVARRMGIPGGCILVQKDATPTGIRQAFHMVSQSAIRASRGLIQPGPAAGFFQP